MSAPYRTLLKPLALGMLLLTLALLALVWNGAPPAARAAGPEPAPVVPPAAPRLEILAQTDPITPFEWTEEEMRKAQPYPMELPAAPPGVRPPKITEQETGVPGWAPSRAPDTSAVWPALTGNPPLTTTPPGFVPTGNYTTTYLEDVADAAQFPYSTMGKVYFTMKGRNYVCSAAVIGENAVWTAGHCVNDGHGVFHDNWVFVPAFHGYTSSYPGPWIAAYAIAPAQLTFNTDLRYDYAVAIIQPPAGAEGRTLRQMTGALGFAWNMPREQPWVALGYPQLIFDGIRLVVSYGVYTNVNTHLGEPYSFGIGSALKSGASGGPWLLNPAAGQVGEANYLGGVNSYISSVAEELYTPYLNDKAKRLWDCAQSSTPDTLGCGVMLAQFSSSDAVAPGAPLTYTLVIHNNGAITATTLTLTDTLPAGVALAEVALPGGVCEPGDGVAVCTLAELAPGADVTATLAVTAPSADGVIVNTALVRSDWEFATDYETQTSVSVAAPGAEADLALTPARSGASAQVGAPFTYLLALENFGPLAATHVVLIDTLPAGVTFSGAALPGGSCGETGGVVTCLLDTLAYGDVVTASVTIIAPMQVVTLTNAADVTADQVDVYPEDNSASMETPVDACWARLNDDTTDYYPLQAALDAAQPGDVVKVAGTCTGVTQRRALPGYNGLDAYQIAYITQSLTLRGGYTVTNWTTADAAAHPTTLDALGQGRAFLVAGEGVSVTLEGLRFTGGNAWKGGGGAVLWAGVTLRDTTFTGNSATVEGGGLYLFQSPQATLSHNTFSDNTLSNISSGGGLALSQCPHASLSDNYFEANNQRDSSSVARGGGGLYLEQSDQALVRRNTFANNQAAFGASGGGILLRLSRQTTLSDNTFDGNQGNNGGGLSIESYSLLRTNNPSFNFNPSAAISSDVFTNNTAAYGGGINVSEGEVTLQGGRFISNSATVNGGGIYLANGVMTAADGCIVYNTDTAVYRVTGTLVVTDTWWGAANGPFGTGAWGDGDSVNAGVVYAPFKTTAPDGCPSRPPRSKLYFPLIFKNSR